MSGLPDQLQATQAGESIKQRLDKYDRIKQMSTWGAGGLVALYALLSVVKDNILQKQYLFIKLVVTGIIFSGVLVGTARQLSDWGERLIGRSGLPESAPVPESHQNQLKHARRCWYWAMICTFMTGIVFLLSIWWVELCSLWAIIAR